MIFDTHAHDDDEAFDEDRDLLLSSLHEAGIDYVVNVAASMESCDTTLELIHRYEFMYGALGVHPSETVGLTEADMEFIKAHAPDEKVVAIGEIGLDYYWPEPDKEIQKKWFVRQLALAKEVKLPVIIHSRDASRDTLDILQQEYAGKGEGIIHCYSYSVETAKDYLDMGFYFGIGGVVTFSNAKKLKETVEMIPLSSIVLETDCPYLSPVPNRGKRNSSRNLPYVVSAIAGLKGISEEEVIRTTEENAKRVFGLLL